MIKRFEKQSESLLIFLGDASGSNAIGRLNEAKGAIEILLSDAYAKRDNVALISFSGLKADPLLLPTKSLVTALPPVLIYGSRKFPGRHSTAAHSLQEVT